MDETAEEELWRLRAIEVDRDQWKAIAREGASALAKYRAESEKLGERLYATLDILTDLQKAAAAYENQIVDLQAQVRSLQIQIKLQDEHNFQVMEFRIATRHWTVKEDGSILKTGDLVPVVLEYK